MKILNEKLTNKWGDWLCCDYLNYSVIEDGKFNTRVKDLNKPQSQIALAVSIRRIRNLEKRLEKIHNLTQ